MMSGYNNKNKTKNMIVIVFRVLNIINLNMEYWI